MIKCFNKKMSGRIIIIFVLIVTTQSFLTAQTESGDEMRAVWIATVKNIDFPSYKFLSVEEQKKEYIEMLDYFSETGINAVMFQVRPAADAFYASEFEPWSEWLTGEQGKAPDPYYDPLKFYIEEAHKRDIEFHAWVNPFRAVATIEFADIAENHITNRKPEWVFTYDIHKYFDPGIPEVREYIINIIGDIVKRYDIDGIHFDDYFYPYPARNERGRIMKIPDKSSFLKYNPDSLSTADWRRQNMNIFIKGVNERIKAEKPWLRFGVAPSGVWRNKSQDPEGSDTRGLAHYDYLYSDVLKWLQNDWIDYVAPQLYWPVGNKYADYATLVNWWGEHTYGKHLYIGQAVYQAQKDAVSSSWRDPNQLIKQLKINRNNPEVLGSIFYKAKSMKENRLGFCDSLKLNYYTEKVSVPSMSWLQTIDTSLVADITPDDTIVSKSNDFVKPENFKVTKLGKKIMLSWDKDETGNVVEYFVYKFRNYDFEDADEDDIFQKTSDNYLIINRKNGRLFKKEYTFVITAVYGLGEESHGTVPVFIKLR